MFGLNKQEKVTFKAWQQHLFVTSMTGAKLPSAQVPEASRTPVSRNLGRTAPLQMNLSRGAPKVAAMTQKSMNMAAGTSKVNIA